MRGTNRLEVVSGAAKQFSITDEPHPGSQFSYGQREAAHFAFGESERCRGALPTRIEVDGVGSARVGAQDEVQAEQATIVQRRKPAADAGGLLDDLGYGAR